MAGVAGMKAKISGGKLDRQNVNFLNNRRLGKKLGGSRHERRRYLAGEVGLPARFVGEGIEDAEGGWSQA